LTQYPSRDCQEKPGDHVQADKGADSECIEGKLIDEARGNHGECLKLKGGSDAS